jgi:hypothetical protein
MTIRPWPTKAKNKGVVNARDENSKFHRITDFDPKSARSGTVPDLPFAGCAAHLQKPRIVVDR